MKTQKTFILSLTVFSILSLLSLNVFSAGQSTVLQSTSGTVTSPQNTSGTATSTGVSPTLDMFTPALQKCGKNYVEVKLSEFPLEGGSPDAQGGDWWGCKLRKSFSYSNNADACPASEGEDLEGATEALRPVDANYYRCNYTGKSKYQTPQCAPGFYSPADTLQEGTRSSKELTCTGGLGTYVNGKLVNQQKGTCYPKYTYYDTNYGCIRQGSTFPENNFNADQEACNPDKLWLGFWDGSSQGTGTFYQICGWRPESSAPVPPSSKGLPPPPPSLPR